METSRPARYPNVKYLALSTFRRDGREVVSPMWFVEEGGLILMRTPGDAGKLKRIRNRADVRLAPCTMTGRVTGAWTWAVARLAPERTDETGFGIARKYGLPKLFIDLANRLRRAKVVAIEIRPAPRTES